MPEAKRKVGVLGKAVKQTRYNHGLHFKLLIVTENLEICFGCGASVI